MDHSFNSSSKDHSIQSNDAKSIHNNSLQLQGKPLLDKSRSI